MFSVFITMRRLFRALKVSFEDSEFRNIFLLLAALILSGTLFYSSYEGWSIVDSVYFSVATLATVGYGDLAPKTDGGKLFTVVYIFVGIGLFVAVASHLAKDLVTATKRKSHKKHRKNNSETKD